MHGKVFVLANAWDAGSARILAGLGFQALATSSGAHAGTLGKRDGMVTREEALEHAVERVAAAARIKSLVLTARTENFVRNRPDLDDTIRRLQAFEKAGADVLMAPGLPDLQSVRKVCAALSKPFNFMAGIKGKSFSVAELEAAGVKRVSLATSLWRAAMSGFMEAAREVKEKGTFGYVERSVPTPEIAKFMKS